ncbi:hypothetical protein SCHPADRAFT_712572 [Schizopora paradoxa]|uniref:F-box domain-containing protein n=1 Tax=Schizopora paradoxa TaxID=27342 RepID=A0A0H2R359_9AGAM|nr:hypothetical protein SCHPADRAFT_712572 [Schizopora paradoxa]
MDTQDSSKISVADIPPDVLYRIVEISLWTHLPEPIASQLDAIKFLSSFPPYNFAQTCRSWRNTVSTSKTLWSSIFLSLDSLDGDVWDALTWRINCHLERAGNLPLTLFLRLSSWHIYHSIRSSEFIALLLSRRTTWKRIALYVEGPIISTISLGVKDLQMLEEIHIGSSVKLAIEKSTFPSLKYLELEGLPSSNTMDWLQVSPNLQELSFLNIPESWVSQSASPANTNSFPFLRTLCITRANESSPPVRDMRSQSFVACVLNSITAHALTVLDLYLYSIDSHEALYHFLQRSSPPLEVLRLDVQSVVQEDEITRQQLVSIAFSFVPSVRELRYRGDPNALLCPEHIIRMLTATRGIPVAIPILLPELEHLELIDVVVPIHLLVYIVELRRQPKNRTLKSVSFLGCYAQPPRRMSIYEVGAELGNFEPSDDVSQLPATLSAMGKFVSEGLELRVQQVIPDNDGV